MHLGNNKKATTTTENNIQRADSCKLVMQTPIAVEPAAEG
jgi:hypothetical protein